MYIYIHIHICVYIYLYIYIYTCVGVWWVFNSVYVYTYTCICIYIYIYIYIYMCVCVCVRRWVFDSVYVYICNIIHRHIGSKPVQRVRDVAHVTMITWLTFRAHYEQTFAEMVVRFVCSTASSVTKQKQWKNVTFTGYRHTSLSRRVSMNESWHTYEFIMAHTHMWT